MPWSRRVTALSTASLAVAAEVQLTESATRPTWEAPGYEAAAQYVVSQGATSTVLYKASVDAAYSVFFFRKHDPARRLVVLRADKLLTPSLMAQPSVADRISSPAQIYQMLRLYGTRFIVQQDRSSGSRPLEWLRHELTTDRFIERKRFPSIAVIPSSRASRWSSTNTATLRSRRPMRRRTSTSHRRVIGSGFVYPT